MPRHGRSCHILLVEDDEATARAIRRLLGGYGYAVHVAGSIAAALALATRQRLDLLICDLQLPDGDGLEIPERLRAARERAGAHGGERDGVGAGATPAIVLSALGSPADVARSRARSFAAHLVKPVEEELLVATIRQVIGGARERGTGGP